MLRLLHIRDFVIVSSAAINFDGGFSVFSGETGAGKSILIDALSLCLGARTDTALIRQGCERSEVSAIFDVSAASADWLEQQEIDPSELILRRIIELNGRSKAYINGTPATLGQLRELGALLVDIHGQHAHQSLLQSSNQRQLLDTQAGHGTLLTAVAQAWKSWQRAQAELKQAQDNAANTAELTLRLQNDIAWLDDLAPQANEWAELCTQQARLAHAQTLLSGCNQAIEALDGESGAAMQAINSAFHTLQGLLRHDQSLEEHCQSLESARILCAETVSALNAYANDVELDPQALARIEERMGLIFDAARRFAIEPEQVYQHQQDLIERLTNITSQDLDALQACCDQAQQLYQQQAQALSQARTRSAKKLSQQISAAMQDLAMQGGQFQIQINPGKPAAHGMDEIEFLVSGHAGVSPRALAKVASGGELARISLALSVTASSAARVPTLIFDEVDAGIGGAVAEIVGRLLQQLGQRHQVLCVTHLAQVAACAQQHYQVSKATHAGQTLSNIERLAPEQRRQEVARMLGGLRITAATLKTADEMLQQAAP